MRRSAPSHETIFIVSRDGHQKSSHEMIFDRLYRRLITVYIDDFKDGLMRRLVPSHGTVTDRLIRR